MNQLYPLKFKTIYKSKIWGGHKIKEILGKDFSPLPNCGETWELSGVEGNVSKVTNGFLKDKKLTDLIKEFKEELLGKHVYQEYGETFPLLVKFIDANDDLSIQVHPDDELAQKRHNSFGKTEMWYILQADEGAKLISGFNQQVDKSKYLRFFKDGQLTTILNQEEVKAEDVFFIPAGRVHTIGKGILLAEIQQTSDVTYRIYDFDRVDDKGQKRELHVDEALDAIDFKYHEDYKTPYDDKLNEPVNLVTCPYFTTNKLSFTQDVTRNYDDLDSFIIYVCYEGSYQVVYGKESLIVKKGDVVLLPASVKNVKLNTTEGFKALESFVTKN